MRLKAINYTRTGRREGDDFLQHQKLAIQKWVEDNNVELIQSFSDVGFTGNNLERPSFREMQNFMSTHHVDIDLLLVLSPDRLGYCTELLFPFLFHAGQELQISLMRVDVGSLKVDPPDDRPGFWY